MQHIELLWVNTEKAREVFLDSGASNTAYFRNCFIGSMHLQAGQAQALCNSVHGCRKTVCREERLLSMLGHTNNPKVL